MNDRLTIIPGHCLDSLKAMPEESVQCCVTSPPYWGLRDYGLPPVSWPTGWTGQHGLEPTPEMFIEHEVLIFREVRRVLRKDGTLWLNLGDCYAASGCGGNTGKSTLGGTGKGQEESKFAKAGQRMGSGSSFRRDRAKRMGVQHRAAPAAKPKDLIGIPWRVALALQADGWYLRSDIIWHKPNPMPESVTDRPTKAHEYIFLLTKGERYFYDAEAIREPQSESTHERFGKNPAPSTRRKIAPAGEGIKNNGSFDAAMKSMILPGGRNKRSVWKVPTAPYKEAHFATFPPDLIKPAILAGTSAAGCCVDCGAPWERIVKARILAGMCKRKTVGWKATCQCGQDIKAPCLVLDPFGGSFTTGAVAMELGRAAIVLELNPDYIEMGKRRCDITPGLALA